MPGTFSQVYIQVVFAVKGRENLIVKHGKMICINTLQELLKGKVINQLL